MSAIYVAPRVAVLGELHALTLANPPGKPAPPGKIGKPVPKFPGKLYAANSDGFTYKGLFIHS